MFKKLLLAFFFLALVTIAFSETTFKAQAEDTITVSDELIKLNDLYKEGIITKEEFSKAKALLLNLNVGATKEIEKKKKKARNNQAKKTTAAERRDLKKLEEQKLIAAKKAERDSIREERKRKAEEEEWARQVCENDPDVKCPSTIIRTLEKINIFKKN